MKKPWHNKVIFFIFLLVYTGNLNGQVTGFNKIRWQREKIAPGLVWKSAHTMISDSVPQNINILIVNTNKRDIYLRYEPGENTILSHQAEKAKAIAAVNAGFFNIKDGGSVTYIRTGGLIADLDTSRLWSRNDNMTGTLLIDRRGKVLIVSANTNNWYDSHTEFSDVLLTGPLLLVNEEKVKLPATPLVINNHPRTAIGKRGRNKILLITLDGRTEQASGMTLSELTELMISLHCKDAVNLDGGGSTTMWISGKPFNGIVNMPCDNKIFDHAGERPLSDILIIK